MPTPFLVLFFVDNLLDFKRKEKMNIYINSGAGSSLFLFLKNFF